MTRVFDTHCDLLSFLAGSSTRSAYDHRSRASVYQLIKGGVQIQTMAIYVATGKNSLRSGLAQAACYQQLHSRYAAVFAPVHSPHPAEIRTRLAIENASAFVSEDEPLQIGLDRLDALAANIEVPLYVSLTWNEENRFGGGAHAPNIGLKPDGREIIDWALQNGVAIDLSHTSDKLADDILQYTADRQGKVIASHSNFREVCPVARNLCKEHAQEIAKRKGTIGLNVIAPFLGASADAFLHHIEYAFALGIEDALCVGADFYSPLCIARQQRKAFAHHFFDELQDASCYPFLEAKIAKAFGQAFAENFMFNNAFSCLNR